MKFFRKLSYLYWIGDYFPDKSFVIKSFEWVKRFYHNHVSYMYYLSDAINRKMNCGKICSKPGQRTLMWGMRRFPDMGKRRTDTASKQLLFVGLARDGQGIEDVLDFLADNKDFTLAIVGVAANGYEAVYPEDFPLTDLGSAVVV